MGLGSAIADPRRRTGDAIMMSSRAVVACVVLAGCGSSPGTSADPAVFAQQAVTATATLAAYQTATQGMSTPSECAAAVNGYGGSMRGDIDQMKSGASAMDDQMRHMGDASRADVVCGMQGMEDELRQHLQVACSSGDMGQNRAEAARHVAAMADGLQHMQMRAAEVSAGTGHTGPGMIDGGWRMFDGGMMGADDHPMGCPGGPSLDGGMPHGGYPMMDGGFWPDAGPMQDGGMGHQP